MNMQKTPRQIVADLDSYIIGQKEAKKAVAVALYNRYRRTLLSKQDQQDITPKNLLMIGPTGVGKTEIARRLAKIVNAPFIKVEATKFTEVGYVGRDVESMVRDLVEIAVQMQKEVAYDDVRLQASKEADKKLVKLLVPGIKKETRQNNMADMMQMLNSLTNGQMPEQMQQDTEEVTDEIRNERLTVKEQLDKGLLDDRDVTIQVEESSKVGPMNDTMGTMGVDMGGLLNNIMPKKMINRTLTVKEAREVLIKQVSETMIDNDKTFQNAIDLVQNKGIIFIDEFDKIASGKKKNSGEVSREGVQRDILPIVEGSQINTKYGPVNTDHILFIASGAFAESKPSDLIAELQGRFPIRVELDELSEEDFVNILTVPNNALVKQYISLVKTDGINITFTKESIEEIAKIAYNLNRENENIGARRLHTVLEKLLEDILFEAPDMQMGEITITQKYVDDQVGEIVADKDLSKYIL